MKHSKETLGSISVQGGVLLTEAVNNMKRSVDGRLSGLQVVLDPPFSLTPEVFSQILYRTFDLPEPPQPDTILSDSLVPSDIDQESAGFFGYDIKYLGHARMVPGQAPEAWIRSALIHQDHPLARARNGHLHFETGSPTPIAYYMRFTIADTPKSLAISLGPITRQNINIRKMKQPEVKKEDPSARVALLLDPCEIGKIYDAFAEIHELSIYIKGDDRDAIYRVIGYPTQDLSFQRKNHEAIL